MGAHMNHMGTYAIICKFTGLQPTEKVLQSWIKYDQKPKGIIDLHLGSKGFFTVAFTNIEDIDSVFEGGPYFYAATSLYMRLWMMNFVPTHETFTSVLVQVRLYSLPLDYWQLESLSAIGNKVGSFVKISEATKRLKDTSFHEDMWRWISLELCWMRPYWKFLMKNGCKQYTMNTSISDVGDAMSMGTYLETALSVKQRTEVKRP